MGYSAGGIVARVCAELLGAAPSLATVTCIASPHRGVGWLRMFMRVVPSGMRLEFGAVPQLIPDSPLLSALEPAEGPRYTSIYASGFDGMVSAESARLAGAENIEISHALPGLTNHASMVHWLFGAYTEAVAVLAGRPVPAQQTQLVVV
jgi:hypothetical protein